MLVVQWIIEICSCLYGAQLLSWAELHSTRASTAESSPLTARNSSVGHVVATYNVIIEPPWSFMVVIWAITCSILQVAVGLLAVWHCLVAGLFSFSSCTAQLLIVVYPWSYSRCALLPLPWLFAIVIPTSPCSTAFLRYTAMILKKSPRRLIGPCRLFHNVALN